MRALLRKHVIEDFIAVCGVVLVVWYVGGLIG